MITSRIAAVLCSPAKIRFHSQAVGAVRTQSWMTVRTDLQCQCYSDAARSRDQDWSMSPVAPTLSGTFDQLYACIYSIKSRLISIAPSASVSATAMKTELPIAARGPIIKESEATSWISPERFATFRSRIADCPEGRSPAQDRRRCAPDSLFLHEQPGGVSRRTVEAPERIRLGTAEPRRGWNRQSILNSLMNLM